MIEISALSARGPAERGRSRPTLTNVNLVHARGVLAVIGTPRDGTSLLLDVLDGSVAPSAGRVLVQGKAPGALRSRWVRVSLDAPLPGALRVEEVCDIAADLRGEPRRPAVERLAVLGVAALARRRVRSLSLEERRAVSLSIALTSKAELILVDEPLASMDPVSCRSVIDALRERSTSSCIVITTSSPRDASRLADTLALLSLGVYSPLSPELAHTDFRWRGRSVSMRLVLTPSYGMHGAAALVGVLSSESAVARVEASSYAARSGVVSVLISGQDLALLSRAVTRAIASTGIDVELIEPSTLPLDVLRIAHAAYVSAPRPGSLPQGPSAAGAGTVSTHEAPASRVADPASRSGPPGPEASPVGASQEAVSLHVPSDADAAPPGSTRLEEVASSRRASGLPEPSSPPASGLPESSSRRASGSPEPLSPPASGLPESSSRRASGSPKPLSAPESGLPEPSSQLESGAPASDPSTSGEDR